MLFVVFVSVHHMNAVPEDSVRFPKARVTDGCSLYMFAETQAQVLSQSSECS